MFCWNGTRHYILHICYNLIKCFVLPCYLLFAEPHVRRRIKQEPRLNVMYGIRAGKVCKKRCHVLGIFNLYSINSVNCDHTVIWQVNWPVWKLRAT
jgi:hypothetical protein